MSHCWQPAASLASLKQAALLRSTVRLWMEERSILEVWTPPLSIAGTTDPNVESLVAGSTSEHHNPRYLHTSPEFPMKRILCANPRQDIYQLATVFRAEELGRFHNSQFSMLEWYRVGMDHTALMRDVEALLREVWNAFGKTFSGVDTRSYVQEVFDRVGEWPDALTGVTIKDYFSRNQRSFPDGLDEDVSACLDLFMDEFVLPSFDKDKVTFLFEYPGSQASLARIGTSESGRQVAERFEVYVGTVELANGFHELADAPVQRKRFEHDLQCRRERSQWQVPIDEHLLSALQSGLPDCAGVALGLDRLHMVLGGHQHIKEVLSFSDDNA